MKIKNTFIFTLFLIIIFFSNSISYADTTVVLDNNLDLFSESAILIDSKNGNVLYGKNENQQMYPASTTKILTAIIAIENCSLTDKISASRNAIMSIPSGYSNANIKVNEALTVQELLEVFLVHSANEAGFILAEHISGSIENFADLMNQKASEIGCKNTHFTNPSGIHDPEHYSTAYDMALIARYCMQNQTFRDIVSKPSCTIEATDVSEKRYFVNTNDLIRQSSKFYYDYAIGIKTGYTSQAKNCLIAGSLKDDLELITVVLGSPSSATSTTSPRYSDTINLFNYGFDNYKLKDIIKENDSVTTVSIKNATKDTKELDLVSKNSIEVALPNNIDISQIDSSIVLNENITAPIAKDTVLGTISYNIDGINYSTELIASHDVIKNDIKLLLMQITSAIFVLIVLTFLLSDKKKKNKKYKDYDSIYKFQRRK